MKQRLVRSYTRALEWMSVLAGLLIIGSCSAVGFLDSGWLGGLAGLVCALFVACVLVGAVFLVTTMSADLTAIRRRLDAWDATRAPGDDDKKDPGASEV